MTSVTAALSILIITTILVVRVSIRAGAPGDLLDGSTW